jgi:hypothetical protein
MTRFFTLCAEPQPKHSGWFCYCTQAHESWVLLEHSSQAVGVWMNSLGFANVSV